MKTQIEVKPITKKEFIAWLKSLPPTKKFAKAGTKGSCPLAKFYKQKYHLRSVLVGAVYVVVPGRYNHRYMRDLTNMEYAFIRTLDGLFNQESVTPANAINILKNYRRSEG